MISYQYDRCKCALRNLNDLIIDRPDYINIVEIYLTVSVLWLWLTWPVGDEEIKMSSENYLFRKVDECVQLSKKLSNTVKAEVRLNTEKLEYTIYPQHETGYYNIHVFSELSGNEGKSQEEYQKHIERITDDIGLRVINHNKERGKIIVGEEGNQIPPTDEVINTMSEFLSDIFSDSLQDADIIIKISWEAAIM